MQSYKDAIAQIENLKSIKAGVDAQILALEAALKAMNQQSFDIDMAISRLEDSINDMDAEYDAMTESYDEDIDEKDQQIAALELKIA